MGNVRVELPFTSPYKRTNLYTRKGKTFYGIWQVPDIRIDGDERRITIDRANEGFLDIIAFKEYKDREFWRYIAIVNGIMDTTTELKAGRVIILPKIENIRAALIAQDQNATTIQQ